MPNDLVFKLVVTDSNKEVYETILSYEVISSIVSSYPDKEDSNEFFELAAQHSASVVRENVAYKDSLSIDVLNLLSKDKSIAVLRNLVRTNAFRENATQDEILDLINLDVEIAQTIANYVESFEKADINTLALALSKHDDPSVVASLAGNYGTPKKVLKTLVNHPDPYVANEARSRLED